MRHAAPRPTAREPLSRAAQLALGALTYAIAALGAALVTLGSAIAVWSLWQWMGVG